MRTHRNCQSCALKMIAVLLLISFTTASAVRAQNVAATQSLVSALPTAVPAGTRVPVVIVEHLRSSAAQAGQSIVFRVYRDVVVGQTIAIPAGSKAEGKVVSARSGGSFGRAGQIQITCDSITMPDGTSVPTKIDDSMTVNGRDASGGAVLSSVIVGGVVGVIVYEDTSFVSDGFFTSGKHHQSSALGAGLAAGIGSGLIVGALTRGGDANIDTGQQFSVVLTQDVAVTPSPTVSTASLTASPPK